MHRFFEEVDSGARAARRRRARARARRADPQRDARAGLGRLVLPRERACRTASPTSSACTASTWSRTCSARSRSVSALARTALPLRTLRDGRTVEVEIVDNVAATYSLDDGTLVTHEMSHDRDRRLRPLSARDLRRAGHDVAAHRARAASRSTCPRRTAATGTCRRCLHAPPGRTAARGVAGGLAGDGPRLATARDALRGMRVVEAMMRSSARSGAQRPGGGGVMIAHGTPAHRRAVVRALPRQLLERGVRRSAACSPASGTTTRRAAPRPRRASARASRIARRVARALRRRGHLQRNVAPRRVRRGGGAPRAWPSSAKSRSARALPTASASRGAWSGTALGSCRAFPSASTRSRARIAGGRSMTASSAASRSYASAMATSTACSRTSASAGTCDTRWPAAARCSTKACTARTCCACSSACPATVVAETSRAGARARGRGPRHRHLPLARTDCSRELTASFTFAAADTSIELYGTQRHAARFRRGPRLARHHGRRLRAHVRARAASARGRRSTSCRASSAASSTSRTRLRSSMRSSTGAPPPITVGGTGGCVRMIDAAYRAAATGARTAV